MRTAAFGDLEAGVWGAVWDGFTTAGGATYSATIEGEDAASDWTISGAGIELILSPEGEAASAAEDLGGFDQLCRVRGSYDDREVDCPGRRAARNPINLEKIDSVRDVSAWFDGEVAVALTALRPRRAKGHEGDIVTAAVFEEGHWVSVEDPRLSTTYDGEGVPTRTTLELWLASEGEEQYPRRAAGEATGISAPADPGGVRAWLFRWHTRGLNGTGVYLLVQPG
jgi:hypothetical protein